MRSRAKSEIKGLTRTQCKVCWKFFFGRANQEYHRECKIKLNNDTARERRKKEQAHRASMRYMDLLLKVTHWWQVRGKTSSLKKLIEDGLQVDKFNYKVELNGGDTIYHVCYKFGWSLASDSDIVTILPESKIAELKEMEEGQSGQE